MNSKFQIFIDLLENGTFAFNTWETIYLTLLSTLFAYIIGLPLGILLSVTSKEGVKPCAPVNAVLGIIVNILRSIPFFVLMIAFLPFAKLVVGTRSANALMIVLLVVAAAPYIARLVESSLKEVDKGVIEAARSMGANTFQIIWKVLLREAVPSLIVGAVIAMVTIVGYTAMAYEIGGGGLGKAIYMYGKTRYNDYVIWIGIAVIVIIVQIIQELGMLLARKIDKRLNKKSRKNSSHRIKTLDETKIQ